MEVDKSQIWADVVQMLYKCLRLLGWAYTAVQGNSGNGAQKQ